MKNFSRNLEILLLEHDLVMIPGLGGFLANYNQAQIDDEQILPPSRNIVFNKNLDANDGLMIHAYMQNYDATYPQAFKQLKDDVQDINDMLNEHGFVVLNNIGTLHKSIDGTISFEQIHASVITPCLFALPPVTISAIDRLQKEADIQFAISEIAELPYEKISKNTISVRKMWKDIAISTAAAIALFFLFVFPTWNNNNNEKIVAGANAMHDNDDKLNVYSTLSLKKSSIKSNNEIDNIVQPQIILLPTHQQYQNALIISQNDINNALKVNDIDGDYTIVISAAANEECALYVINQLNKDNLPGAYYHSGSDGNFIYYSNFNTVNDAINTINALKQVNKRFKKAWVKKIK